MSINHEIITNKNNLPVNIFSFSAQNLDRYIPKHWHRNTELLFCIEGSLRVWEGSSEYLLRSNDVIVINPNQIHATQSPKKNLILVIQFPLDFMKMISAGEYNRSWLFNVNTLEKSLKSKLIFEYLNNLVKEVNCESSDSVENNLKKMANVYNLLAQLVITSVIEVDDAIIKKNDKNLNHLSKVVTYINENYKREISLDDVSAEFNYSKEYFSRYFKKYLGINFTDYVNAIRLDDAFKRLINSDQNLLEISLDVGFVNYRNFYNLFKKTYQVSPREYRKLYQKK